MVTLKFELTNNLIDVKIYKVIARYYRGRFYAKLIEVNNCTEINKRNRTVVITKVIIYYLDSGHYLIIKKYRVFGRVKNKVSLIRIENSKIYKCSIEDYPFKYLATFIKKLSS